jgi:hypothetical protein
MYTGLLHLHSFLRWVILILAIVAIYKSYTGWKSGRPFTAGDKKVGLFLLISAHIQLLIGLYQWIFGPWGLHNIQDLGFGTIMKDKEGIFRFYAVEHIFGMIVAIVLITVARVVSKKPIADTLKHKKVFILLLIALILMLATIPWPFRAAGAGRHWF